MLVKLISQMLTSCGTHKPLKNFPHEDVKWMGFKPASGVTNFMGCGIYNESFLMVYYYYPSNLDIYTVQI
jgi:hypothetical protein